MAQAPPQDFHYVRFPYKEDDFGNAIEARVVWSTQKAFTGTKRPVALIYHAGGLIMGSCKMVPKSQIEYLVSRGYIVVVPDYRLIPQVTGKTCFKDAEDAYDWAVTTLGSRIPNVTIDPANAVALGYSSGGTMVLHLASLHKPGLRAVTAFYPFVLVSDKSTSAHSPANVFPDSPAPTDDWTIIAPANRQVTEAPFSMGDAPRAIWMKHIFSKGTWMENMQPDGNYEAVDPVSRPGDTPWPPVMMITGSEDNVPGRSPALIQQAGEVLKKTGTKTQVEIVDGGGHLFDHGELYQGGVTNRESIEKGLQWLTAHSKL